MKYLATIFSGALIILGVCLLASSWQSGSLPGMFVSSIMLLAGIDIRRSMPII